MNQNLITHWILGVFATLTWFWGDKVGVPPSAINLAAWIVPGLLAHALGQSANTTSSRSTGLIPGEGAVNVPVLPLQSKSAEIMPSEPSIIAGPAGGGGAASEVQS
jgi:hypothetical protein